MVADAEIGAQFAGARPERPRPGARDESEHLRNAVRAQFDHTGVVPGGRTAGPPPPDQTIWRPARSNTGSQSAGGVAGQPNMSASAPGPSSRARSVQAAPSGSAVTAQNVATPGR
ncbi:hypothetical protein GCM10020295_04960 [Streptomyces cinereospinus]